MRIAIPVTTDGRVDHSWGRAARVAVADINDGMVAIWQELDVGWDRLHDASGEGNHHARIARFLIDNKVERVAANHIGPGMVTMLEGMGIPAVLGVDGDARQVAIESAR
jgi:predicted Fe-Mo cluster-binding NifX family protein